MVERRNERVLSFHEPPRLKQTIDLSKLHGSVNPGKQQMNARKLSNSTAAGGGAINFRLIDEDEVFDCQIDGADREHDPERNG
jgi:hypothetical protein